MRVVVPVVLAALVLVACSARSASAPAKVDVAVSVGACGRGWSTAHAGLQQFVLHNVDTRAGTVDLVDASNGAVYAEVEPLAPGTSIDISADLGSGRYAFRCAMEDETAVTGPTVSIGGHAEGTTPAVLPVTEGDLIPATQAYEKYVGQRLPVLARATGRLQADLRADDLAAARRDWLVAHLDYVRLGAAYGAFGHLAADIDERADGLAQGVHDRAWRGFHRIEFGLWHGSSASALGSAAAQLMTAVDDLGRSFPHMQIDPLDIAIRAHEITEDAMEITLAGRDDYGSGSALPTVRADVDATRTVLATVRPLLVPRYRDLDRVYAQLDRTQHDLDATRTGGRWPAPAALGQRERERIDSDVAELAELLAPVAAVLEPRRTS